MTAIKHVERFVYDFDLKSTGKWFALSSLVGVVAGVGAVLFLVLGQTVTHYTLGAIAGFYPAEAAGEFPIYQQHAGVFSPWLVVAVMTGGGLVSGILVYTFAPEAEGHGTDAAIEAFHHKRGIIRPIVPIIKTLASAITIGTGGSGGREGPIAQIGAGFGSYLATRLQLPDRDRRIMLAAGMGAGVGAIFRAPMAGALFAGEILYKDAEFESDVIVPTAISSIVGYSVFNVLSPAAGPYNFMPLFGNALKHQLQTLTTLLPMGLMALILVLVGILYIKTFYGIHKQFAKLPILPHLRPAVGAGMAGLFALALYYAVGSEHVLQGVLSTGYGPLQLALENSHAVTIKVLLVIAFGKIITTSLTIGSGGSGGVFGPSMVIGGCLGAAIGMCFNQMFGLNTHPGAYAIVGMAGFFAGCAHAPISTIIMVSEMTGDYQLLLPAMWVSMLCFLLMRKWTLYIKQSPSRLESPAHRGDFIVDVLEGIKVADVYQRDRKIKLIAESTSLDDIVHTLARTNQHYFPVVDAEEHFVGIFSADDVRTYLYDETIWQLAVARDIMITTIVSVTPEDDLNTALRRFTSLNLDELPVLDPQNPQRLLGMLRRKETIAFYNRRLMEHKQGLASA